MPFAIILSAVALSAAPAAPQQGNLGPSANARPSAEETLVCKYAIRTGTRFKRKTCRTRAQWDAISESSRDMVKGLVDRPEAKLLPEMPPR